MLFVQVVLRQSGTPGEEKVVTVRILSIFRSNGRLLGKASKRSPWLAVVTRPLEVCVSYILLTPFFKWRLLTSATLVELLDPTMHCMTQNKNMG